MAGLLDDFLLSQYANMQGGMMGGQPPAAPPMQLQGAQPQQGPGLLGRFTNMLDRIADPHASDTAFERMMRLKEYGLKERALEDKPQIIKVQDPNTGYERAFEVTVGKPPRDITADLFKGTGAPAAGGATGAPTGGMPVPPPGANLKEFRDVYSKKQAETAAEAPQIVSNVANSFGNLDRLKAAAMELREHPGIDSAVGGLLSPLWRANPGTPAADFAAKLEALKSQVGLGVLQDMRDHSKTGGALGNVSDAEGKRLENNLAALDPKQNPDTFWKQLDAIVKYADTAKKRIGITTQQQYGRYLTPEMSQILTPPSDIPMPRPDPRSAAATLPGSSVLAPRPTTSPAWNAGPAAGAAPGGVPAPAMAPGPMPAPPAPAATGMPARSDIEAELRRRGLLQ